MVYGYGTPFNTPPTGGFPNVSGESRTVGSSGDTTADPFAPGESADSLVASLEALYPWVSLLGIGDMLDELVVTGASAEQIVAAIRTSAEYKTLFPGMTDANGQRRFASEAEYLQVVDDYRTVLRQFGAYDPATDNPSNYLSFIDLDIDPNELAQRFEVYRELEAGSKQLQDAFYVYSGMEVSVDDLYQAVVSPEFRNSLTSEYDRMVALQEFDYQTYITRATQRGLERAAELLRTMQNQGLLTGQAVSKLLDVSPEFAREVMGALAFSDPADTETLGLDALLSSFEYAMLASAATENGLSMPSLARIAEIRQAGVSRSQALQQYGLFSKTGNALSGFVQRANLGEEFSQKMFEEAVFLGRGAATRTLEQAVGNEVALGRQGGQFATQLDQSGRLKQIGRL